MPPDRLMSLTQPILPICYRLPAAGASCYETGPLPPTLLRPFADDVGSAVGGACAQRSLEGLRRQAFAQRKPWYMLAPSSLTRTLWDTAAILLIWVLLFTVPLSMGATGGAVRVGGPGGRSHHVLHWSGYTCRPVRHLMTPATTGTPHLLPPRSLLRAVRLPRHGSGGPSAGGL